jgi:hypothetical protein
MEQSTVIEAFLVVDGFILETGSVEHCQQKAISLTGSSVQLKDMGDKTVLPGFIDCHAHPLMYGQMMSWVDCSPAKANSIPEIIELLKVAMEALPAGAPVRGYGYEQRNLQESRHPTRFELDTVSTTREVYLMNASGHGGVVNSFTLESNGITRETKNPKGGEFFRDENGELTGELSDAACNVLTGLSGVKIGHHGPNFHLGDEPEELVKQLEHAQQKFLAGGVSSIGDAQVSRREFSSYQDLAAKGQLKFRVGMYFLSHLLDQVLEMGFNSQFGNPRLNFSGIKLYADGTLGGWTAYFPEGYLGDPCRTGQLYHEPVDYEALVEKAHKAGLQTATHAQSPTAIGMVIDAVSKAQRKFPRPDARHRIEHCGLPSKEQMPLLKSLGIRPVNQTQHYYNWGEGVKQAIGTPGERFNPLGEFSRAEIPISISSDAPVAEPKPLEAIMVAANRLTRRGEKLGPDDLIISVQQALEAHTINAAVSLGRELDLGSIEIGKRADFVVLGADPLAVEINQIASIEVLETWIGGIREFEAKSK